VKEVKIGDKVNVNQSQYMYDADGEIIGETKLYWRVKITNHRCMGALCEKQESCKIMFHKRNNLQKGYSKLHWSDEPYSIYKKVKARG